MQNWDNGGTWDAGFQWDVENFPSLGDISVYLALVTSEHDTQPNFMASLAALLQPVADINSTLQTIQSSFDVDTAVASQLDQVGEWVGVSRTLKTTLVGVYFSFDIAGIGFDQGTWLGPSDSTAGAISLSDDAYRLLLYARIAANTWDGTIPSAYAILNALFSRYGYSVVIQDNNDMTMNFGLAGGAPDAVTIALLTGGYLSLRPAGVGIAGYYINSVPDTPLFGFDVENATISGFDVGSFGTAIAPI